MHSHTPWTQRSTEKAPPLIIDAVSKAHLPSCAEHSNWCLTFSDEIESKLPVAGEYKIPLRLHSKKSADLRSISRQCIILCFNTLYSLLLRPKDTLVKILRAEIRKRFTSVWFL